MIKANELRLGNWVLNKGRYLLVQSIDDTCINVGFDSGYHKEIEPIPLTPDILEKVGFIMDRNGFALPDKMSLSFSVTKDGEYLLCWLDKSLGVIVRNLHQLQNLYFALTGTELEIIL